MSVSVSSKFGLSTYNKAVFILILSLVFFAIGNVITKFIDVGPTAAAFYRLFLAMPMTWALLLMLPVKNAGVQTAEARKYLVPLLALICGLSFSGEVGFLHYAYMKGTVSVAIFLKSLSPLFVIFGAWVIFKEIPTTKSILCLVIALPGVFLLSETDGTGWGLSEGNLAAIMSAICLSVFLIAGSELRKYLSTERMMFWTNLLACAILLPVAFFMRETLLPQSTYGWAVVFSMAFVSQVLGMNLYAHAMGVLSPTMTSLASLLQPVITLIFACWILNEFLKFEQVLGAVIILIALGIHLIPLKLIKKAYG